MRKFTKQQVDFICYQIGEWYLEWKNQLVDYDNKQHRLGYAKELLKESELPFIKFTDKNYTYMEYLDAPNGCTESCEVFPTK